MENKNLPERILTYTRTKNEDYTESLANSVHFALLDSTGAAHPFNRNYGILFAKADVNDENVIVPKGIKNPHLFTLKNGGFGIVAVRVDETGADDEASRGHILLWVSKDLTYFEEGVLVKLHDTATVNEVICRYNTAADLYEISWKDNDGNYFINTVKDLADTNNVSAAASHEAFTVEAPELAFADINPGNTVEIDSALATALRNHWLPLTMESFNVAEKVTVSSAKELNDVQATVVYSDDSTAKKNVEWDTSVIDFATAGTYEVKGTVRPKVYPYPLAKGYADPVILPWNDKYYYIATNDNAGDVGLYVREGDTIDDLFREGFNESIILDYDEEKGFVQTFWAPEFHVIGGDLYILFAIGGKKWAPHCHMMKLSKGGDIMNAADWDLPRPVTRADGSSLSGEGITLDMTYFNADGVSCLVWSYRHRIGTPLDTGSMLCIATIDESNPYVLTSEPLLLSRPLYGWENIQGTINNEGPYPLVTDDYVHVAYSGGAANGYTYAVGLLSIPRGSDYLDIKSWHKANTPILSYYSAGGVYGPGHNSFFRDYDGSVMMMYHGEEELVPSGIRCSAMHRVHFNKKGQPVFNLTERELPAVLAEVSLQVEVKPQV